MDFSANKQDTYEKRIASLPDQPNMQPDELKAYFDSSPEEIRQAHNGLCDALTEATSATSAAAGLGFQRTAGVPADTVQAAIENVQAQLDAAVMGNIPSGSVTQDKLAQDVRDRFTAIENSVTTEASTRANADSNLQAQITTLGTQKSEVYMGTYVGDEAATRTITLGFRPRAVILCQGGTRFTNGSFSYGGVALDGYPAQNKGQLTIVSNGFTIQHNNDTFTYLNSTNETYYFFAFH